MSLELAVVVLGLGILLGDLWTPAAHKKTLGYAAAAGLALLLTFTIFQYGVHTVQHGGQPIEAFGGMFIIDDLSFFFKQLFVLAAFLVLIMSVEYSDRIQAGISEFYCIILFALTGMLFSASATDFMMVFVSLELITISFYVLNSFLRSRISSLEAGIKYLILGALSTAFLVFGIALIFGTTGETNFGKIQQALQINAELQHNYLLLIGILLVLVGLGFKIAAFPFQIWAPDVYQGSPAPATAFLAIGSKAAGIVLLMRVLFKAVPVIAANWSVLLMVIAAATILYGNLCALAQRNVKRLLGYSSIANAGYMLLGFCALNESGSSALLYYLVGYLFTVLAAFTVICVVTRQNESDDISTFAGLNQRSPLLAATMTLAMVSLAGIPPLAGFFGKFLLLKAVVERGATNPAFYWLVGIAIAGVVMSLYYYFGVIRAIYWSKDATDLSPLTTSMPTKAGLALCILGMLYLGVAPDGPLRQVKQVASTLQIKAPAPVQSAELHETVHH